MPADLSTQTSWRPWISQMNRLWPVSRSHEAEFPPAAQTALELIDWTLRGSRALDRASFDALRPKGNWFKTEDYYEISIHREKLAASASRRIPSAVRQRDDRAGSRAPAKKSFWQKVAAFFGGTDSSVKPAAPSRNGASQSQVRNGASRPERVCAQTGIDRSNDAASLRRQSLLRSDGERLVRALQWGRSGAERGSGDLQA